MRMSDAPISILGCAGPRLKARQRALKANSEAPDRFAANVRPISARYRKAASAACVESPRRYLRAE
jgi:hypothetical protein